MQIKDTQEQRRIMQILRRMTLTKVKKSKKLYNRKKEKYVRTY